MIKVLFAVVACVCFAFTAEAQTCGGANNLTSSGPPVWDTSTQWGGSAAMPGSGAFMAAKSPYAPPSLNFANGATIEAHVKATIGQTGMAVDLYDGQYGLQINANGTVTAYFFYNNPPWSGVRVITTATVVADGAWHDLRLSLKSGANVLYIDGVSAGATTDNPAANTGYYALAIGGESRWRSNQAQFEIDEVAIFSVPLSGTLPTAPYSGSEAGLVSLYHLDSNFTDSAGCGAPPVNTSSPLVTVPPVVGGVVNATAGTWTGATSFVCQWFDGNGTMIAGATTCGSYVPAVADIGQPLYESMKGCAGAVCSVAVLTPPTLPVIQDAATPPPPVNGVCGTANGVAASSAPTANLCATGSATSVTGAGPWAWSCNGSNGGTNAACSAPLQVASSGVLGNTIIEPKSTDNSNFNVVIGPTAGTQTGYTITAPQTINDASFFSYPKPGYPTTGHPYALALYDSTGPNGTPGKIVAQTAFFGMASTPSWETVPVTTPVTIPAGTYWPAWMVLDNSVPLALLNGVGESCWAGPYNTFQDPFPQTSPAGNGCNAGTVSFCFNCSTIVQNPAPPPATTCSATPTTQAGNQQMAVLAPCSATVATANQLKAPLPYAMAIADTAASVSGAIPISVQAQGMARVEVWTHGALATTLTAGANGMFTGTLTPAATDVGPLRVRFNAYDVLSGTAAVQLTGEYTLILPGTPVLAADPPQTAGMTKLVDDTSIGSHIATCASGTWPGCASTITLSQASGAYYLPKQFNGQDYGYGANMPPTGTYNPYTVLPSGDTRIRTTWDSTFVDPYGFGRNAYTGFLSTATTGGASAFGTLGDGYYELTWMKQNGACGSPGNDTCSVGNWPSFWTLWSASCAFGCEIDSPELYGEDWGYYQAGTQGTQAGGIFIQQHPFPNNPWGIDGDWHTSGLLISGGGTKACFYLDNTQLGCGTPPGPGAAGGSWVWMITQALGGGWVVNAPPSNYIDFYVRRLRLYQSSSSAPAPVNGACGSANGVAVSSAPSANLCGTGTASAVAGSGPWTWTCAGLNGGTTASCSAPLQVASSGTLPCDVAPCVSGYSTTRSLKASYAGPLFQIQRASDSMTLNIPQAATGRADLSGIPAFCSGTQCGYRKIYDNITANANDLWCGPQTGGFSGYSQPPLTNATLTNGKTIDVYIKSVPGPFCRNLGRNNGSGAPAAGMPLGTNKPLTEYWVARGGIGIAGCCFDFGQAENTVHDDGNGTMFALGYYGTAFNVDEENGGLPKIISTTVFLFTGIAKTDGATVYSGKWGNAQSGALTTTITNAPLLWTPVIAEGGIVLAEGGDGSTSGTGGFTEGAIFAGQTSDAADNAIQASIVGFYGPP